MRAVDVKAGFTHGRWTVLSSEFERLPSGAAVFSVRCACGTEKRLRFKGKFHSDSCGCIQREVASALMTTHGRSKTTDYKKFNWLKRQYGIDEERWNTLLTRQNGVCGICKTEVSLHVDHDHSCCSGRTTCGECIRGLLCQTCNQALGFFGDSITTMKNAIIYLEAQVLD